LGYVIGGQELGIVSDGGLLWGKPRSTQDCRAGDHHWQLVHFTPPMCPQIGGDFGCWDREGCKTPWLHSQNRPRNEDIGTSIWWLQNCSNRQIVFMNVGSMSQQDWNTRGIQMLNGGRGNESRTINTQKLNRLNAATPTVRTRRESLRPTEICRGRRKINYGVVTVQTISLLLWRYKFQKFWV
jgi:hypothetical protein